MVELIFAQECQCTNCQRNVYLKMVKMMFDLMYIYFNKKM